MGEDAADNESSLQEKPEEYMMKKEQEETPTTMVTGENSGVEEIKEQESCDDKMEEGSEHKEDTERSLLAEENADNEVVTQNDENKETVEQEYASKEVVPEEIQVSDQLNKETLEQNDEPDDTAEQGVVVLSHESIYVVEKINESDGMVPQEVVEKAEESKDAVGEDSESKELAASENQVKAFEEEQKLKKETSSEMAGVTKALNEDGQIRKLSRCVNEEEVGEDKKVKEGNDNGDAADKEKNTDEAEAYDGASETVAMEVEMNSEKKGETVDNGLQTEQVREKHEESSNEKTKGEEDIGSKKRKRGKIAVDKTKGEKKDEQEQATPLKFASLRPVRERKSVERLVASIEKDVIREILVEKGAGVALKDIPNVAYKLSKKRNDETFKQLHTILFGRRGKAIQMKNHVSQFSGFVWHDNEEKQKMKVKEKFDRFVKEKLLEFCDVLDIEITNKVTTRKEDVVTKIMDFLTAPHATTDVLLSEKEQSEKTTKRKRASGQGSPTLGSPKGSRRQRKKISETPKEGIKHESDIDDKSDKENEVEVVKGNRETGNAKQNQSEEESSEKSAGMKKLSESEDAKDENIKHRRRRSRKISAKVDSSAKKRTKPEKPDITDLEKATDDDTKNHKKSSKKSSVKVVSTRKTVKKSDTSSKVGGSSNLAPGTDNKARSSKVTTGKKNQTENIKEKISVPSEPSIRKKTVKTDPKVKSNEAILKPSDKVLRDQICQILKEVDLNTATFTDILKLLGEHFTTDLTPRKSSIKVMIQEELTKMADDADDEEDGEADATTPNAAKING
uniref:DEK-C domain-containing protein n=1 Tax=Kalanchoe fedtschenkoi TaxID=63787 RepID=A0A7N0RFS1_KALFE